MNLTLTINIFILFLLNIRKMIDSLLSLRKACTSIQLFKIKKKNMFKLFINADDFGLNASVNKAIVESFNSGLINSTTVMANMPGFEEAVNLIHEYKLDRNIGVHLVLTDGLPLTEEIKSMNLFFSKKISPQIFA